MTVLVLGIAMFLPLALHVTLTNLDRLDLRRSVGCAHRVHAPKHIGEQQARALAEQLRGNADVAAVELISPDAGPGRVSGGLRLWRVSAVAGQQSVALGAERYARPRQPVQAWKRRCAVRLPRSWKAASRRRIGFL